MHAGIPKIEAPGGIASMKSEVPSRLGDHVLDQTARKAEASALGELAAPCQCQRLHRGRRIAHADLFQHVEYGLMDAL
jgi:hypothetical protein